MPQFNNAPPANHDQPQLRIMRAPASPPFQAIITSDDLVGCPIHWYAGRTLPCELENCPACGDGLAWRWKGYVACVCQKTDEHCIFEFPAAAGERLAEYRNKNGTLRGCQFRAYRIPERPNGRLLLRTQPSNFLPNMMPKEVDVVKCLLRIWQIPIPQNPSGIGRFGAEVPTHQTNGSRLSEQKERTDRQPTRPTSPR